MLEMEYVWGIKKHLYQPVSKCVPGNLRSSERSGSRLNRVHGQIALRNTTCFSHGWEVTVYIKIRKALRECVGKLFDVS